MKAIVKICMLLFVMNTANWIAPQKAIGQVSVSFQLFYDDLSPYGTWVDNPDYGYVWIPDVSAGFIPYRSNGYWIFTDEGWTWVSNYSWGWAPFHYGRWYNDPDYGPVWIPGNQWGPGWVTWRRSEGYYGWAPIGPGISIDMAYSSGYNLPNNQWTFVRERNFGSRNITNYYINRSNNTTIINNSTVINNVRADRPNNIRYNAGPDRTDVQKRTGNTFNPVTVRESVRPGQRVSKSAFEIYKPRVENSNPAGQRPAPTRVMNLNDAKKVDNRKSEIKQQAQQNQQQQDQQRKQQQQDQQQQNQQKQQRVQQQQAPQNQQQQDQQRKQQQQNQQQQNQQKQQRVQQQAQQNQQQQDQQRKQQQQNQQQQNQQKQQQVQQQQQAQQNQQQNQQRKQQQQNQQQPAQPHQNQSQKPPKTNKPDGE